MNCIKFENALSNYEYLNNFLRNKVDFLSEKISKNYINENKTIGNQWRMFINIINFFEKSNNKDLALFSQTDIKRMFKLIPSSSLNSFKILFSLVNNYQRWAIERGLNPTGDNPCDGLDIHNISHINTQELNIRYLSWDFIFDLYKKTIKLKNTTHIADKITEQNFLLLCLMRLGLKGKKWSEVLYLKEEDIDFDNKIINVTNRNSETESGAEKLKVVKRIKIEDDRIIDIIKKSKQVKGYTFIKKIKNGVECSRKYIDTGYLIKAEEGQQTILTVTVLRSRLALIYSACDEPHISPTSLFNSARLDYLLNIKKYNKFKKLSIDDFIKTQKFFEPNSCDSSYVTLKELYTNTTKDNLFFKNTQRYDEYGNRIFFK